MSATPSRTEQALRQEARFAPENVIAVPSWERRRTRIALLLIEEGKAVLVETVADRYNTSRFGSASPDNRVIPGVTHFIKILA